MSGLHTATTLSNVRTHPQEQTYTLECLTRSAMMEEPMSGLHMPTPPAIAGTRAFPMLPASLLLASASSLSRHGMWITH